MLHGTWKQRLVGALWPRDRLLSARSEDGLHWQRDDRPLLYGDPWGTRMFYYPKILTDQALTDQASTDQASTDNAVPEKAVSEEARFAAGAMRLLYPGGPASDGFVALEAADGGGWRPEEEWRFRLPAGGGLKRVDGPEVVRWARDDWRLFFAGYDGHDWRLYQARAVDPVGWAAYECCLDLKGAGPLDQAKDPCLFRAGGNWYLCFTRFAPYGKSVLALAREGRDGWEICAELDGLGMPGWGVRTPCAVALPAGGWRLYFSRYPLGTARHSRLDTARSDDGRSWRMERETVLGPGGRYDRHGLFCPSVVRQGQGWRMVYAGYWGRHLFEPLTLLQHRPRRRRASG